MMSSVTLSKLLVFFYAGFAVAFPAPLSPEQAHSGLGSSSSVQKRSAQVIRASSTDQGDELFVFDHWQRNAPSRVRERDPQSTIFQHAQWDECVHSSLNPPRCSGCQPHSRDQDHTSPLATTAIFANDQWEARKNRRRVRDDFQDESHPRQNGPRDDIDIFKYPQRERREEPAGSNVGKRKSTGPVFFAKGQWEEE
ncbi:hypothetical protein B0H11DRAFT_2285553 [Mycena galericulata]|nr:hypothetical protein B0H11DRAFT_2285553 [Mycena galericulata]